MSTEKKKKSKTKDGMEKTKEEEGRRKLNFREIRQFSRNYIVSILRRLISELVHLATNTIALVFLSLQMFLEYWN